MERLREILPAERMARFDVVAAGPGLGTGDAARALLEVLIERARGPMLLDADALNIAAAFPSLAADRRPAEAKFLRLQRCRANSLVALRLRTDNRPVTARAVVEVREVPAPLQRISPLTAAFGWI